MAFSLLAFKSDTLAADITDSANSMTLTTGAFGTPTGEQMLVIDYNIAAKREIVKCAIDGTAVTSMTRAQDGTAAVAHTSGAKIIMAFVPSHYTGLTDGTSLAAGAITDAKLATKLKAGWDLLAASGTRASNTQMTVTGDITDRLWVGKPLELTDTTTKYFNITSFSYSSPNTTINFTGGTDYVLVGNPTNIYGGLHNSPVGFPTWFNWTPTLVGFSSDPPNAVYKFKVDGRSCTVTIRQGSNGTSNATNFTISAPIAAVSTMGAACNDARDNAAIRTDAGGYITAGGSTITLTLNGSNVGWTNSGAKAVRVLQFTYDI